MQVACSLIDFQPHPRVILVGNITPKRADSHYTRLFERIHHCFHILCRIHRVRINVDMIFSTGMVQSAETGKTTTMLRFREIRHTASLVNLRCAILRFVVHTNDFYRIFTLHLAQRPETGEQMFFLIVSDERYSDKRFVTLQSGQIAAYFLDNGLRSFRKRFLIYL